MRLNTRINLPATLFRGDETGIPQGAQMVRERARSTGNVTPHGADRNGTGAARVALTGLSVVHR